MSTLTIEEIRAMLDGADEREVRSIERTLDGDPRKGVKALIQKKRVTLEKERAESARVDAMYLFEQSIADEHGSKVIIGLDEVGRGPMAGPLTVGAVVLDHSIRIGGLNDSKQVAEEDRERIAEQVRSTSAAWSLQFVEPAFIDAHGMTASLKHAFKAAIADIESTGVKADIILLDGNSLHLDPREINVVKGDSKCASIAAASIIAKVARDELMVSMDAKYPGYGFASNKGYGTKQHRDAISTLGLTDIHRTSFCSEFLQGTLF